jgi:hypothetical protein
MLSFAADENFNNHIVRGLLRRRPNLDIVLAQEAASPLTPRCMALFSFCISLLLGR